jgi:Zn-dependent alcohol dehydrogenase
MENKSIQKTLKAAVLFDYNKPLKIIDLNIPKLTKGQVLVKIKYSGICGTQIIEMSGGRPHTKKYLPNMMGHEASGTVVDIGPGVKKVGRGDEVILSWIHGKGLDSGGIKLKYKNKFINAGPLTTFSNFTIASENRVFKKPNFLSMKDATLYGCAIPTGAGMILNQLKGVAKDKTIFLFGLGGVGLSAYLTLKICGYKNIYVVDRIKSSYKKKLIKKLNIKVIRNINFEKFKNLFNKFYTPDSVMIDTTGDIKAMQFAYSKLGFKGKLLFASHPPDQAILKIKPYDLLMGKKIIGSRGGFCRLDHDILRISQLFKKHKISHNLFFGKEYKLLSINNAINDMKKGKVVRPIISM